MKKKIAFLLAMVMAFSLLTACGSNDQDVGAPSADGAVDETLVVGTFGEPATLFTLSGIAQPTVPVANLIYDALLIWDNETKTAQPCVATEWEMVDDVTWRFKIREDIIAHDGTPFTAEDVLYTFKKGVELSGTNAWIYFDIEKCKVVDEFTIDIVTYSPMPYLLDMMSNSALNPMIDQSSVETVGGTDACITNPLCGTGPYRFVEWVSGEYILLERNENYWGEKPYYKNIQLKFIGDNATRIMALESGDVDMILNVPISSVEYLRGDDNYVVWQMTSDLTYNLIFNTTVEPFDDVKVRQAIAHLVDRDTMLQAVGGGYGMTTDTNIPQIHPYYSAPGEGETYAYDVDAAKALLAEAGYADGFSFKLTMIGQYKTLAEVFQSALSQAGIQMEMNIVDMPTLMKCYYSGDYEVVIGTNMPNGDLSYPLHYYDNRLSWAQVQGSTGWGSDEMNALIDVASTSADTAEVAEAYAEIQSILRENVPVIGFYSYDTIYAGQSNLTGATVDIRGMAQLRFVQPVA